jgi:hypothetical protein
MWGTTDEAIVALNPSDDGMSCTVVSAGAMGTAQITVRLDADVGDGVQELTGMALVDVTAGQASTIAILLGQDFDPDAPGEDPLPDPVA